MRQLLMPIILAGSAIALFVMYTNPAYQKTKIVQTEVFAYDDALNKSQELRRTLDEKLAAYNTFSEGDRERLLKILPDNVDNIRLIIDIESIAARRNLALKNVALGTLSDSTTRRAALAVGASGSSVGSVELSFSISSSYDNMLAFMQDLERSLRVIDIESVSFTAGEKDLNSYEFKIRTYWLH